ncbi:alpha/beta hydrolase [Ichthyenterobacterium sp. W332]|uniref:Alpha/beta hydrolase n=1 Tax=Microcosmobacter mediterraneus TaxID=3075607 RepID=A0ABU2YIE7_9FLAO|nr:alpha/beta hydrolase [Ichthyenterobacterium sp. W332]MDT0557943.1 alpha/beta hydrolase [Ichthyenterobacterium sp. W332]
MIISKNNVLKRVNNKPILWDLFYVNSKDKLPLIIFCHGYKGFKDWGAWDLVAKAFAIYGYCFLKFNFSHNGGTVDQPIDFPDLQAFGNNNYTKELEDLDDVLNFCFTNESFKRSIDVNKVILIGHSRGGGIVTIKAAEDPRISHLITWAGVCDFSKRTATAGNLQQWKTEGVKYVVNGRTKQQMPHYYQFYEDYIQNKERLDIEKACKKITIPHLIAHGIDDPSVKFNEAEQLHAWNPKSVLQPIKKCDHVFNTKHPWEKEKLSEELKFLVNQSIMFIM